MMTEQKTFRFFHDTATSVIYTMPHALALHVALPSSTETLLRLLLPLNDKVQWTSRDVAGGGPLASPRSEHFTGPFNR
ncbi:hypothetical protein HGB47_20880 [Leptospira yasudae]|nr:hypothetical protein [Leptospira yasudae]